MMQVKLSDMPIGYRQAAVVKSQLFGDFPRFDCLHRDIAASPFPRKTSNMDLRLRVSKP